MKASNSQYKVLRSVDFVELNEALKLTFQKLHMTVVSSVNSATIINFLFQEAILGNDDLRALHKIKDDPQQQCSELLALLHTSRNPQSFVQLYAAIKRERQNLWLIEQIDQLTDKQQQRPSSETTGEMY